MKTKFLILIYILLFLISENLYSIPVVLEERQNCNEFYLKIEDLDGIDSIKFIDDGSINTKLYKIEKLNSKLVICNIKLIDNQNNGLFLLKITNIKGESFNYRNDIFPFGFNSITKTNEVFNNNSRKNNDTIILIDDHQYYSGSVWLNRKVNVFDNFTTSFKFTISNGKSDCDNNKNRRGDGFAFVIQNNNLTTIGAKGGGIGYAGIKNAMAIEFDTFSNDSTQIENYNDPNNSHIGFACSWNGKNALSPIHKLDVDGNNGYFNDINFRIYENIIYNVTIEYSKEQKSIKISIDSLNIKRVFKNYMWNFKIEDWINLTNGREAYLGFTSSSGCAVSNVSIFDWELCSNSIFTSLQNTLLEAQNILISPNPASDYITISHSALEAESIEIYNIFGEKIPPRQTSSATPQEGNFKIDISNLPAGVYFIKIGDKLEKFIKW